MWEALKQTRWVMTLSTTGWLYASISVIHHFSIVLVWSERADTRSMAKLAGLIEMLLWICVIAAAVEIPNH